MPRINLITDENNLPDGYVACKRINGLDYTHKQLYEFIEEHCVNNSKPLVVSNMNKSTGWNQDLFTLDHLKQISGDAVFLANMHRLSLVPSHVVLGSFIQEIQKRYNIQPTKPTKTYPDPTIPTDKIYAKDIICPEEYRQAMNDFLPEYLLPYGTNDLFSILPDRFKAENLMCYLGQDKTGTPIHRDLCGTMGHNVMVMSTPDAFAEWYIIDGNQRDELAAIIEPTVIENKKTNRYDRMEKRYRKSNTKSFFMESDRAWLSKYMIQKSNIKIQVIIQKIGDLVIVPSRAYHQVRNHGVTVKIAWNRITPVTLKHAFQEQIPLYRIINRPEVYKCKAIVAFTIKAWSEQLDTILKSNLRDVMDMKLPDFSPLKYGVNHFIQNVNILSKVFLEQVIYPELLYEEHDQSIPQDGPGEVCVVICDFCHSDVFYRYYHCDKCDQYDLCLDCYAMGRSCKHINQMTIRQSPESILNYITLYKNFTNNINLLFGKQIEFQFDLNLLCKPSNEASNLATTCRRIELYRKLKPLDFNRLICSHCSDKTTVSELCKQGYTLSSVFKRGVCPSIPITNPNDKILKVYVCVRCTNKCKSCFPFSNDETIINNYDLVYYLHPGHDQRNYGGYIDFNVTKTCDYPYADTTKKAPHRKYTKKNNSVERKRNLRKLPPVDYTNDLEFDSTQDTDKEKSPRKRVRKPSVKMEADKKEPVKKGRKPALKKETSSQESPKKGRKPAGKKEMNQKEPVKKGRKPSVKKMETGKKEPPKRNRKRKQPEDNSNPTANKKRKNEKSDASKIITQ